MDEKSGFKTGSSDDDPLTWRRWDPEWVGTRRSEYGFPREKLGEFKGFGHIWETSWSTTGLDLGYSPESWRMGIVRFTISQDGRSVWHAVNPLNPNVARTAIGNIDRHHDELYLLVTKAARILHRHNETSTTPLSPNFVQATDNHITAIDDQNYVKFYGLNRPFVRDLHQKGASVCDMVETYAVNWYQARGLKMPTQFEHRPPPQPPSSPWADGTNMGSWMLCNDTTDNECDTGFLEVAEERMRFKQSAQRAGLISHTDAVHRLHRHLRTIQLDLTNVLLRPLTQIVLLYLAGPIQCPTCFPSTKNL